jgi:chromosome segregation ATPase
MKNRIQSVLVNDCVAVSSFDAFIQMLRDELNIDLPATCEAPEDNLEISPLVEYLAATLLFSRNEVSTLYDDVRSAGTLIGEQDNSIAGIKRRVESLTTPFLDEVSSFEQLKNRQAELEESLALNSLQLAQAGEELEGYYQKIMKLESAAEIMSGYLDSDPLLRIARQARESE